MNAQLTAELETLLGPEVPAISYSGAQPDAREASGDDGAVAVCTLTPEQLAKPSAMHAELARELDLPSYYGKNWDALLDVLTDPFVLGARKAFVLVLTDGVRASTHAPAAFETLLQVLQAAHDRWRAQGEHTRVRLLVVRPDSA